MINVMEVGGRLGINMGWLGPLGRCLDLGVP